MSTHKVTIEVIASVKKHHNADKLDICTLDSMSYQFVTQTGQYKPGDKVIYFPIDSVISESLAEDMGISHLVSHKSNIDGVRIRTVKLRGEISQGMVVSPSVLDATKDKTCWEEGDDVTDLLGVTKYEPHATLVKGAKLFPLPNGVGYYDLENAERYPSAVDMLMDEVCYISEKVEGSHFAASICFNGPNAGEVSICSRRHALKPDEDSAAGHTWLNTAERFGLDEILKDLFYSLRGKKFQDGTEPEVFTIRGEIAGPGIQGNYYGFQDHRIFVFEFEVNDMPVDAHDFIVAANRLSGDTSLDVVPHLSSDKTLREWLDGKTIAEASNGKSLLADKLREGIVIKPIKEMEHEDIGRLVIKQRSPEYLSKSKL